MGGRFHFFLLYFATAALLLPTSRSHDECGVDNPSPQKLQKEALRLASPPQLRAASHMGPLERIRRRLRWMWCRVFKKTRLCRLPRVVISVALHDIAREDGTSENKTALFTDQEIQQFMDHANSVYKDTGFSFVLQNITRTVNSTWFDALRESPEEQEMMSALSIGAPSVLNAYFKYQYSSDGGLSCGYGRFAEEAEGFGDQDGIFVTKLCTGPGDGERNGDSFPHEIGHWLNLYHPDAGGCEPPGDLVGDTPYQGEFYQRTSANCPHRFPNTCKWRPGRDPIDNLMSSAGDACRGKITRGQAERMHRAWEEYREP